jgi:hypothetical protein
MRPPRVFALLLLATTLAVSACGGGSSGGGTAAGSASTSTATSQSQGSGGGSGSDQKFCDVFKSASSRFGTAGTLPTDKDLKAIRQFADDIESNAPAEIKSPAKDFADYFRLIADVVEKHKSGSDTQAQVSDAISKFSKSIGEIGVWSSTHCSTSQPSTS